MSAPVAGLGVNAVKSSAAKAAPKQAVTCFHRIFHATTKITETNPKAQKGNGGVTARYAKFTPDTNLVSVLVSVADAKTPKPLLHTHLGMEPMAGIERPD
jgi:hypothetical protein